MTEKEAFEWAMLAWVAMMIITLLAVAVTLIEPPRRD